MEHQPAVLGDVGRYPTEINQRQLWLSSCIHGRDLPQLQDHKKPLKRYFIMETVGHGTFADVFTPTNSCDDPLEEGSLSPVLPPYTAVCVDGRSTLADGI